MNHPSACTIKAIHDYFNNGTLPEVGTVCEPDKPAFEVALESITASVGNNTGTREKRDVGSDEKRMLAKRGIEMARARLQYRDFETEGLF